MDNIHNIISILIGWGYKFKILIDQDTEGRKEFKILFDKLAVSLDDIKFVDGTNIYDESNNIFDREKFSNYIDDIAGKY